MSLAYPLALGAILFGIGLYGALVRTNAIRVLMCVELMLSAVNLNLIAFSQFLMPGDMRGHIFTLLVMTIAASETAVGIAIVLIVAKKRNLIDITKINLLKG